MEHATKWSRVLGSLGLAVVMAGCASLHPKEQVADETQAMRRGPESAPQRTITGFSDSLRCMDSAFITYNVRDVSLLVEDIVDNTKKVNAGTKDMLISAVSDMTKRSQGVRLVIYGQDAGSMVGFLREADRKSAYAVVPPYDIKGSISQLDESLVKRQIQGGIGYGEKFSIGGGASAASNVLGMDLTVLSTDNLSVVPGVTARNSVVIMKSGNGVEADATIGKLGANFGMSLSRSEGQAQALRALVELSAIELMGKLTRTPYWTCLGASADNPAVQQEIADWFQILLARPANMVAWYQYQLRARGYYSGPVDGEANDALRRAVAAYRAALGLSPEPKLDLAFFSAYLNADHQAVVAKFPPPPPEPPVGDAGQAPGAAPAQASATSPESGGPVPPLALSVSTGNRTARYKAGEHIQLRVAPNRDAFVYCYWQDEGGKITRVYPNRFAKDSLVAAAHPLELPGSMKFHFFANDKHAAERIACIATERDVLAELPGAVSGTDFEPLQMTSLNQIKDSFRRLTIGELTVETLDVHAE